MTTTTIAQDLAAANLELTNPHKDGKADAGQYSYSYATLDAITALVRPVLANHGISITQDVTLEDGRLSVTTTLLHSSGESLTFGPLVGPSGSSWQQLGSGISYARRYQLLACLGLAAGDDDDAQQLSRMPEKSETASMQAVSDFSGRPAAVNVGAARGPLARDKARALASDEQKRYIGALVRKLGYADSAAFLESGRPDDILGGAVSNPLLKGHAIDLITQLKADVEELELATAQFSAELDETEQTEPNDE